MNNRLCQSFLSLILVILISSHGYARVQDQGKAANTAVPVSVHPHEYSDDPASVYDYPPAEFAAVIPAGPLPVNRSSEYNTDRSGGAAAVAAANDVRPAGFTLLSAGSGIRSFAAKLLIYPFHSHW